MLANSAREAMAHFTHGQPHLLKASPAENLMEIEIDIEFSSNMDEVRESWAEAKDTLIEIVEDELDIDMDDVQDAINDVKDEVIEYIEDRVDFGDVEDAIQDARDAISDAKDWFADIMDFDFDLDFDFDDVKEWFSSMMPERRHRRHRKGHRGHRNGRRHHHEPTRHHEKPRHHEPPRRHERRDRKVNWLDWDNDDNDWGWSNWNKDKKDWGWNNNDWDMDWDWDWDNNSGWEWEWEAKPFNWSDFKEDMLEKMRPTYESIEPYWIAGRDMWIGMKQREARFNVEMWVKLAVWMNDKHYEYCADVPEDFTLEDAFDYTALQVAVCSENAKIAMNYVETAIALVGYEKLSEFRGLMRFLNVEDAKERTNEILVNALY